MCSCNHNERGVFSVLIVSSLCSVGITCAVRAGHVVGERKKLAEAKFETISGPKFETISTYDAPSQSNKIASCRIRYATRDKLEVMGLISSASRSSSFTSKCPPNLLPDKYSAAHMEDCLKFYFGPNFSPFPCCDSGSALSIALFSLPLLPFLLPLAFTCRLLPPLAPWYASRHRGFS